MDSYKKSLLVLVITLGFNYVNSQVTLSVLDQFDDYTFKENYLKTSHGDLLNDKNNFQLNYFNSPMLNKSNGNKQSLNNCTIDKTAIAKSKKSTLFELNKINGAEYSNTLYLMTLAIYRV